jgi:hypothetical protein
MHLKWYGKWISMSDTLVRPMRCEGASNRRTVVVIRKCWLAVALLLFACGPVLGTDELSVDDDVIAQYLKQQSRAELAADADTLAKHILSTGQIERIIAADKKETVPARRLIHWRVLQESQSPIAHDYLQKALAAADTGQAIDFVQSLRVLRGQDVPLLTTLYEQSKSDLLQNALVSIAQADPRALTGCNVFLTRPPGYSRDDAFDAEFREYEKLAAKALFLYQQWLVANSNNIEHRRAVYTSVSPYDHQTFIQDGLRRETDTSLRRTIYEVLVKRSPGNLLQLLDSDEPESTKLACMKLALLQFRAYKTQLGSPPHYAEGLPDVLREMELGSPALEKIKAELIAASGVSKPEKKRDQPISAIEKRNSTKSRK